MGFLIDTNVILDLILHREDRDAALALFERIDAEGIDGFTSASSVTDFFYIVAKQTKSIDTANQKLSELFELVDILPVFPRDIHEAYAMAWRDFEDAVLMTVAKNNGLDCVITNNKCDFEDAPIPVMTPLEYCTDSNR